MQRQGEVIRLQCEHMVNNTWAGIGAMKEDLERILEQGGPKNSVDMSILIIVGNACLQKIEMEEALDEDLFN